MNTIDKSNLLAELYCIIADAGNQANAAKKLSISPSYLCDVLSGKREPGKKLLLALKFKRVITYEPIGYTMRGGAVVSSPLTE